MKKLVLVACMAIGLLGSCKEDRDTHLPTEEGVNASFKLTLSLPQAKTRAVEHEATVAESEIENIYIFVFNQDGSTANDDSNGHFGPFYLSTHFTDQGGGVYNMNSAVTTTAGIKVIYVATNLSNNGLPTSYVSENAFLTATADIHNQLIKYDNGEVETIVMIGKETETLEASIEGNGDNTVYVDIERAVARVITTSPATFQATWATPDDMTFTINKYFVTQDAHKSYLGPNFFADGRVKTLIHGKDPSAWSSVLNLYNPQDYLSTAEQPDYLDIYADPDTYTGRAELERFYIGENAVNTATSEAQFGNTTYAWVQTYASITRTAKVNAAGDGIEYDAEGITGGTDDLYIIRVRGINDYICNTANFESVADFLEQDYPGNVFTYVYPKSYVYYRVYLNKTETTENGIHKYNVYRNQFIHIDVTGLNVDITKPGGFGSGYPGDKTDPEVPVDPTEPDTNNPDPVDPVDPIDEKEATLLVNITVKPWVYVKNSTILE